MYSGGLHVVDATLQLRTGAKQYQVTLDAATQGFLHTLAPWSGRFFSKGDVGAGKAFTPREHVTTTTWRDEKETEDYTYDRKGAFTGLKVTEQGRTRTPDDLDPTLAKGTVDILTATLSAMRNAYTGKGCAHTANVFDGERSFTIIFRSKGKDVLAPSKYSSFAGEAEACEVEIKPLKGRWHKKPRGWLSIQEQGRKKGALPLVWFARQPGFTVAIPVRLRVTSNYGTLFMHLITPQAGSLPTGGKSAKK